MSFDFRQVYQDEHRFVWRAVRRLGVKDSQLEDLVHDVFAAAFRSWSKLEPGRPIRPWLFGICYRVVSDHLRKFSTQREEASGALEASIQAKGDPAESAQHRQGLSLAQRIIDGLEFERRAVFVMHELEELPMPEVAQALGIPLNTAYSRLRLARRDFESAASVLREPVGGAA